MTEPLDEIREDVAELKRWADHHDERHGDDADMLGRVLDSLQVHTTNHHGRVSTIKQNSGVAAVLTVLYVAVELLRRFFL